MEETLAKYLSAKAAHVRRQAAIALQIRGVSATDKDRLMAQAAILDEAAAEVLNGEWRRVLEEGTRAVTAPRTW